MENLVLVKLTFINVGLSVPLLKFCHHITYKATPQRCRGYILFLCKSCHQIETTSAKILTRLQVEVLKRIGIAFQAPPWHKSRPFVAGRRHSRNHDVWHLRWTFDQYGTAKIRKVDFAVIVITVEPDTVWSDKVDGITGYDNCVQIINELIRVWIFYYLLLLAMYGLDKLTNRLIFEENK